MYALNLAHSPERMKFWVNADPIRVGAGDTAGALGRVPSRTPGVSDSIELSNGAGVTRRVSQFLRGNLRVWRTDKKGGGPDD